MLRARKYLEVELKMRITAVRPETRHSVLEEAQRWKEKCSAFRWHKFLRSGLLR